MMGKTHKQTGFTIVELLIVIVVIGILAAITIVAYSGIQLRARDSVRTSDVKSIQKAIELYYVDNGFYPSIGLDNSGYDAAGLITPLAGYVAKLPIDPKPSTYYQYVRGPVANNSYAIRVQYEAKTQCKMGTNSALTNWWGIADC